LPELFGIQAACSSCGLHKELAAGIGARSVEAWSPVELSLVGFNELLDARAGQTWLPGGQAVGELGRLPELLLELGDRPRVAEHLDVDIQLFHLAGDGDEVAQH